MVCFCFWWQACGARSRFVPAANIIEWRNQHSALPVEYETLVGNNGPDPQTHLVGRISRHLQGERSPQTLENTLQRAVTTTTLTSSGVRTRKTRYGRTVSKSFLRNSEAQN
jgi:hypothetical protein